VQETTFAVFLFMLEELVFGRSSLAAFGHLAIACSNLSLLGQLGKNLEWGLHTDEEALLQSEPGAQAWASPGRSFTACLFQAN